MSKDTCYLALDLGTKCGWASRIAGRIESGHQDFSLKRGESKGMLYIYFRKWLVEMLTAIVKPDIVALEKPGVFRSSAAYEILYGMSTRVMEECVVAKIEYLTISPNTIKKFATGKGNAAKDKVFATAKARFGDFIETHDQADARFLLEYVIELLEVEKVS